MAKRKIANTCWRIEAYVTGTGVFPFDMLRYDKCFPARGQDVIAMWTHRSARSAQRTVMVAKNATSRTDGFTADRWASFGWKLTETTS